MVFIILSVVLSALLRFTACDYVFGFFCVICSATSNFSCSTCQGYSVVLKLLSRVKPLINSSVLFKLPKMSSIMPLVLVKFIQDRLRCAKYSCYYYYYRLPSKYHNILHLKTTTIRNVVILRKIHDSFNYLLIITFLPVYIEMLQ